MFGNLTNFAEMFATLFAKSWPNCLPPLGDAALLEQALEEARSRGVEPGDLRAAEQARSSGGAVFLPLSPVY